MLKFVLWEYHFETVRLKVPINLLKCCCCHCPNGVFIKRTRVRYFLCLNPQVWPDIWCSSLGISVALSPGSKPSWFSKVSYFSKVIVSVCFGDYIPSLFIYRTSPLWKVFCYTNRCFITNSMTLTRCFPLSIAIALVDYKTSNMYGPQRFAFGEKVSKLVWEYIKLNKLLETDKTSGTLFGKSDMNQICPPSSATCWTR